MKKNKTCITLICFPNSLYPASGFTSWKKSDPIVYNTS